MVLEPVLSARTQDVECVSILQSTAGAVRELVRSSMTPDRVAKYLAKFEVNEKVLSRILWECGAGARLARGSEDAVLLGESTWGVS